MGGVFLTATFFAGYTNYFVALPLMCIGGLALGAYNVLPYPMVGDSLDYLEWKTGSRMEGVCFSLNSFVTKFNNAIGAIMLSAGIIVFGFQQPEVSGVPLPQSEFTLNGLFAMVTLIPAVFFLLSIIPMAFNTFTGKNRARILAELSQRRAESKAFAAFVNEECGEIAAAAEEADTEEESPAPDGAQQNTPANNHI